MSGVAGNSKNAVRLPLFLSALIHLGGLLLATVAPKLIPERLHVPEVYQVELYTPPEWQSDALPTTPPLPTEAAAPPASAPPKAGPKPAISTPLPPPKVAAISLAPLKERLARENRQREEARRNQQLTEQVTKVKLDLQQQRAAGQAREAARLAREAIAETYRTGPTGTASPRNAVSGTAPSSEGWPSSSGEKTSATWPNQGPGAYSPAPGQLEAQAAYIARLKDQLRRHWKLPVLQDWDTKLSATMIIKIRQDGSVITTWFERHSNNPRFDQYVKRAVDQSLPLPPLPREFSQKSEEIAVTFTPGGLK